MNYCQLAGISSFPKKEKEQEKQYHLLITIRNRISGCNLEPFFCYGSELQEVLHSVRPDLQ